MDHFECITDRARSNGLAVVAFFRIVDVFWMATWFGEWGSDERL